VTIDTAATGPEEAADTVVAHLVAEGWSAPS
jgi:hypothetical protein